MHFIMPNGVGMIKSSSQHFPALDGLRGIAVLSVLLFHAFLTMKWPGETPSVLRIFEIGWIGVDLFFVLSGYLITTILLKAKGQQRFFVNFYARRMLRIMPAYYLLLVIVFIMTPLALHPNDAQWLRLERNQAWLWLHLTNWGFVWNGGVFTSTRWLELTHLWSLAVEEQFYLVWPAAVLALSRLTLKRTCWLLIALSPALRLALWWLDQKNGALYFPTPCRLDGLAMGALVAIWRADETSAVTMKKWARAALLAGAVVVGALIVLKGGFKFNDRLTVAIGMFAVSIIASGAVAMVVSVPENSMWSKTLGVAPLRDVGKISYGLYLYHAVIQRPLELMLPVDDVETFLGLGEVAARLVWVVVFVGISLAVAVLSWMLLERKCLTYKKRFEA